jgi:peptide/nickel transport system substrate-binding protein
MRRLLAVLMLLAACADAPAQTLRWAGRGDVGSMDPHAFNEGFTGALVNHVYEQLGRRARDQSIEPSLAESWQVVSGTVWRFRTRAGVKWSDGTPFTATDAVFSIERAQQATSQQAYFARQLGKPVLIDERTFELRLDKPNPLLLEHQLNVSMMSAAWCKANGAERVPYFTKKEEAFSSRRAMGTGPFILESWEPGVRAVLRRNAGWWDKFDGNVQRIVYTPIGNDATRTAALLAGDTDLTHDTPPQDVMRLANESAVRLHTGPENRVLFFAMDQGRDELLYSNVKGRNPFKDLRVRQALLYAIDAQTIQQQTMRGQSQPTACLASATIGCLAPELETRPAADPVRARALLAEAGYPQGFEVQLDCPNDRYVNDQAICVAAAAMLGRVGIKVRVDAKPKTIYFQKIERQDTSFYLLGWGGGTTDPQSLFDPVLHRFDATTKKGEYNYARSGSAEIDALIDAAAADMDASRRRDTLAKVQRLALQQLTVVPLHRQMITWASRRNVMPVVMPDNAVRANWVRID